MQTKLDDLEALLHEGNRRSGQTSLVRRSPAKDAIPYLAKARAGLRAFVKDDPDNARAWRLLSFAEETLLAYGKAAAALERALQLSGKREKKELKRLALLRSAAGEWADLGLTPVQLAELGAHLESKLESQRVEENFAWTESWLAERGFGTAQIASILDAFRERGAFSDAQVLYDIV